MQIKVKTGTKIVNLTSPAAGVIYGLGDDGFMYQYNFATKGWYQL